MRWGLKNPAGLSPTVRSEFTNLATALRGYLAKSLTPDGDLRIGIWSDYAPFWTTDGTGAQQPAVGDGSLRGQYTITGATMFVQIQLRIGTTTSPGTGIWRFGLPVPPTGAVPAVPSVATVWAESIAGPSWIVGAGQVSSRGVVLYDSAGPFDGSTPVSWAAGDRIHVSATINLDARSAFSVATAAPAPPPPPPPPDLSISWTGPTIGSDWSLSEDGPLLFADPGTYTLTVASTGYSWVVRGAAAGGTGGDGFRITVPPIGINYVSGGGGGSGARHAGLTVPVSHTTWTLKVGHAIGDRETSLQHASGYVLRLGGGSDGFSGGAGGDGGVVIVGAGGSNGSQGSPGQNGLDGPFSGGFGASGVSIGVVSSRGAGGAGGDSPASEDGMVPGSAGVNGALLISLT